MSRALLYARYSTTMQSQASVEDQMRLLRQRAGREDWTIVGEFADRAISGTVRERPGLVAALRTIEAGEADILLAEALDRISRDQEDIAGIHKRVRFHGARMVTLSEGEITTIHIGMGGTMSALFLEQLAEKTRRGQIGRVEAGRIPGGLSYGYRKLRAMDANGEPERGLRAIDEAAAGVVRRIFGDYVRGLSPLAIARNLNTEGIPGPRGGLWRANTIVGHRKRRNGILYNELYRGRILYNRQTFRKDPETRKRVARTNDEADLVAREVPELRIIEEDLWNRAQELLARNSTRRPEHARRARRLLSGLMRCAHCGGAVNLVVKDRWGCANWKQTGACDNHTTITDRVARKRIWAAIREHLLHPDVVEAYCDELRCALVEERRDAITARAAAERRLAELDREEERITDAIVAGLPLDGLRPRAEAIADERKRLTAELAATQGATAPLPHPQIARKWRLQVERLHELALTEGEGLHEARALLTGLVDRIEVGPRSDGARGAELALHGNLAALLTPETTKAAPSKGSGNCTLALVAGVGFEPTTFRL